MPNYNIPDQRVVEVKQHLEAVELPALSAFTSNGFVDVPFGSERVTFVITYVKHGSAAAGRWTARLAFKLSGLSDASESDIESEQLLADPTQFTISEPTGQVEVREGLLQGPEVTASQKVHHITVVAPDGVKACRLRLAEVGDTTNRGTVSVVQSARRT